MKNKTVTLSGVFCVLIGNTRSISTVKEIKPSPYTPDLAAQRRYRRVWSIIVSAWTVKKSPPSVKARTTRKVEITRFLSDNPIASNDRMAFCHAVIFVFLCCRRPSCHSMAAKHLPRCRSPPRLRKFEPWHIIKFSEVTMKNHSADQGVVLNFFNHDKSCLLYFLSFTPESGGEGVNTWARANGGRSW